MGFLSNSKPGIPGVGKRFSPLSWIIIFLVILVALSLGGLLVLQFGFTLEKDSFEREIGIVFLQIIAVGVIGSIFSLLLAQYTHDQAGLQADKQRWEEDMRQQESDNRLREEKARDLLRIEIKNKNDLKKDIIKRLSQIYHDVKGVRRMLRAKVLSVPYDEKIVSTANVYLKPYAQYMETFNDLQLDLEGIKDEIKHSKIHMTLFSKNKEIYDALKSMEHYLGEVFSEYETCKNKFNEKSYAPYSEFVQLRDMLGSAREGSTTAFRLQFILAYKGVIADMLGDLVVPDKE
ncbi:hypothetical protein [Paraflavitalea speifideaquila]|uniref:hypothetical protein n=1 Tax=Paraflavitalea speifideaquila TaxID=3076558 RepID=UPI0028E8C1DE|nr:hypothetical protein [Paraflavitalea speifideiaquila]